MGDICKNMVEKVSSYDVFNNFFPGIILCYLMKYTTRFSFDNDLELWEKLFVYHFIGMVINCIGSIFVEKILRKIEIKNKGTNCGEKFLDFVPYEQYIEASEKNPFIAKLSEINNTYRTMSTVFIVVIILKLYDSLLFDRFKGHENTWVVVLIFLFLLLVFVFSYRKQTDYIRQRVNQCCEREEKDVK